MIFTSPFSRLFEDFGQIFDETPWGWADRHGVAVNVWSNEEHLVVQAELPGIDSDSIELSVHKDRLLLKAERRADMPDDATVHQSERLSHQIERSIQLPYEVDEKSATAEFKDGILHVAMNRVQADKPKNIKIKIK